MWENGKLVYYVLCIILCREWCVFNYNVAWNLKPVAKIRSLELGRYILLEFLEGIYSIHFFQVGIEVGI